MFTVTIETDNAAFEDGNEAAEIARILETIARHLTRGHNVDGQTFNDANGNSVAKVTHE